MTVQSNGVKMKKYLLCLMIFLAGCGIRVRNYTEDEFLQRYNLTLKNYDKTLEGYVNNKKVAQLEKQFKYLQVQLKSTKLSPRFKEMYNHDIENYLNIMEDLKD